MSDDFFLMIIVSLWVVNIVLIGATWCKQYSEMRSGELFSFGLSSCFAKEALKECDDE